MICRKPALAKTVTLEFPLQNRLTLQDSAGVYIFLYWTIFITNYLKDFFLDFSKLNAYVGICVRGPRGSTRRDDMAVDGSLDCSTPLTSRVVPGPLQDLKWFQSAKRCTQELEQNRCVDWIQMKEWEHGLFLQDSCHSTFLLPWQNAPVWVVRK